ncbi:MAG: ABC transporter ATP-binding protein [Chloroflexi bacterium]|nr:MAG: ABC transporter ATP-binding protein [Chloroflexota bacterium]
MSLLEIDGVVAGYGRGPDILRGVDLTVEEGEVQCIIGPNGAGKSTLLKTIAGLLRPRKGRVVFQGEVLNGLRPDQIIRRGIAFLPQERSLFPDMTVLENLRMGGYALEDKSLMSERIEEAFAQFPILKERYKQKARTLSGGQQQMLVMGRALVLRPHLVMLDEPSLGLAPQIVAQLFEIVRGFKDQGMTVLMVEQNARQGLNCADRGCVLDLGQRVFDGPADGILDDPRIQELYLGTQKKAETS